VKSENDVMHLPTKSMKGTKNISYGFLANGVMLGIHSQTPRTVPRRYTHESVRDRRSGRDAGTQAQGGETIGWDFALIKHL